MTDSLFLQYQARGITARSALIISRKQRDADPLSCNGETFLTFGTNTSWVNLL